MPRSAIGALLLALCSCAPDGEGLLVFSPARPTTQDPVQARPAPGSSDEAGPEGEGQAGLEWTWEVDGEAQPDLDGPVVPPSRTRQGEIWRVTVRGLPDFDEVSGEVEVVNSRPDLVVRLVEEGGGLRAVTRTEDADDDTVSLSYTWTLDGLPTPHVGAVLPPDLAQSGQDWQVEVVASDGTDFTRASATRTLGGRNTVDRLHSRGLSVTRAALGLPPDAGVSRVRTRIDTAPAPAPTTLQVVVVLDITGSFKHEMSLVARELDVLAARLGANAVPGQQLGLVTFFYNRAQVHTPLTPLADTDALGALRADWRSLRVVSRVRGDHPAVRDPGPRPHMPREYDGEQGTDHHVGLAQAQRVFAASPAPEARRAVLLITDGQPMNLRPSDVRERIGYHEARWDVYEGPVPHSRERIRQVSIARARDLFEVERADVSVISVREDAPFLRDMVQGQGWYTRVESAEHLTESLTRFAEGLAP